MPMTPVSHYTIKFGQMQRLSRNVFVPLTGMG